MFGIDFSFIITCNMAYIAFNNTVIARNSKYLLNYQKGQGSLKAKGISSRSYDKSRDTDVKMTDRA